MSVFVSKVERVFQIAGRGCVIMPGIPKDRQFHLKVGDLLLLRRPDGSEHSSLLRGIELIEPRRGSIDASGLPILLGLELTEDQIPIGTEVWAISEVKKQSQRLALGVGSDEMAPKTH